MDIKSSGRELTEILLDGLNHPAILAGMDGSVSYMNSACTRVFGAMDYTALKVPGITGQPWGCIVRLAVESAATREYMEARVNTIHGLLSAELSASKLQTEPEMILILLNVTGDPDTAAEKNTRAALLESEARNRALIAAIPDIMFRVNSKGEYLDKMLKGKISEIFPLEISENALPYISRAVRSREIGIYEYPVTVAGREEYYEARFVAMDEDEILVILRNVTGRKTAMTELEIARREAERANSAKSEFLANMSHEIRTPLNSITGFIELLMRSRLNESQREYLGIIRKSASSLLDIINDILDFSKIESHKLELNYVEFNPYTEFDSIMNLFRVKAREKGVRFCWFMDPQIPVAVVSDPLRLKQVLANLVSNAIKFTPDDGAVSVEIRLMERDETGCRLFFSVTDTGIGIPVRKQKQIFEAFMQADNSITRRYGGTGLGLSISSNLVKLLGGELVLESETGRGSCFSFMAECGSGYAGGLSALVDLSGRATGIYSGNVADRLLKSSLAWFFEKLGSEPVQIDRLDDPAVMEMSLLVIIFNSRDSARIAGYLTGPSCKKILVCYDNEADDASRFSSQVPDIVVIPASAESIINAVLSSLEIRASFEPERAAVDTIRMTYSGRVLVGEDNRINQKLMMLLLRDYGVESVVAGNGLEVFDRFKKEKYDLVLMDINMPAADGIETTRMIREYEEIHELPRTPIVALTAKVMKNDRDAFAACGMDGYIVKPVEMDRLEAVLTTWLQQGEPHPSAAEHDTPGSSTTDDYDVHETASSLRIPDNVLVDLCREFFSDMDEFIAELHNAVDEKSTVQLMNLGHRLKGASANLRFRRLSILFSTIEEKSAAGDAGFDYGAIIDDIKSEISRLKLLVKQG